MGGGGGERAPHRTGSVEMVSGVYGEGGGG